MAAVPFVTDWRVKLVPHKTLVAAMFLLGSGAIRISEDGPEPLERVYRERHCVNRVGNDRVQDIVGKEQS